MTDARVEAMAERLTRVEDRADRLEHALAKLDVIDARIAAWLERAPIDYVPRQQLERRLDEIRDGIREDMTDLGDRIRDVGELVDRRAAAIEARLGDTEKRDGDRGWKVAAALGTALLSLVASVALLALRLAG